MSEDSTSELWPSIRVHPDRRIIDDAALVLTAVHIPSSIEPEGAGWALRVPLHAIPAALQELEAFRRENSKPSLPAPPPRIDGGWVGVAGFLLVIWSLPTLEGRGLFGIAWSSVGVMDATHVLDGQWWRTITALTLHADLGHLFGNSIFGAVFGLMLGRHLGSGLGWLLVVVCAALGNAINAVLRGDDFQSLGASTATFAALALVGTFVTRRGYYRGSSWRQRVGPAFAAFALLAFTGFGGERTDLIAHIAGFAMGALAGIFAATLPVHRWGRRVQLGAGAGAIGLVVVSWVLAAWHG